MATKCENPESQSLSFTNLKFTTWSCKSSGECAASFETLYELVSHMRSCHSESRISCEIDDCQERFSSPSVWYWHIRRKHFSLYQDRGTYRKRKFEVVLGESSVIERNSGPALLSWPS